MIEMNCVVSGIGASQIGRRLNVDPWKLTADAALAAIADAGLTPEDIDGISTYPGVIGSTPGITGAGVDEVRTLLGLKTRWQTGGIETAGQLGSIVNAAMAVACGVANHVLCFRTVWESTAQSKLGGRPVALGQSIQREMNQWSQPYGFGYSTYGALLTQRYMYESGITREQLGQIAVVTRAHAALNPAAVYRTPLTLDEYLDARMISTPVCLYDCDVPVDGSLAFVISRADSKGVDQTKAVKIEAMGSAAGIVECSNMMWSSTRLTPNDVNVAQLYDGFSILAILWLEAMGLSPKNGAGKFIEGGDRISLGGEMPLNTGGGQLSGGRMHGYGQLHEACVQLRGLGEARQVKPTPNVAVVGVGAANLTSCLLLSN